MFILKMFLVAAHLGMINNFLFLLQRSKLYFRINDDCYLNGSIVKNELGLFACTFLRFTITLCVNMWFCEYFLLISTFPLV